jgi:hypothetical protein
MVSKAQKMPKWTIILTLCTPIHVQRRTMKKALLIQTIIAGTITTHIMALLDEQQQPTKGKDQMVQAV